LNIIHQVVEEIRQEVEHAQEDNRALSASKAALDQCSDGLEPLKALVKELEPKFLSRSRKTRKLSAFKAVWDGQKIRKFQENLRDTKLTLLLARQNLTMFGHPLPLKLWNF